MYLEHQVEDKHKMHAECYAHFLLCVQHSEMDEMHRRRHDAEMTQLGLAQQCVSRDLSRLVC